MLARELLRNKRLGQALNEAEITFLVQGMADGRLGNEQLGAFAMAVALNGMSVSERVALTLAMRDSGRVMHWKDLNLPGPVLDKHSTGGVGDSTSLLIGPWVAACGGFVPMITGRGLGHTGGTCDKLESIPGYDTAPDPKRFRQIVAELGVAIIGQTGDLAPADRRLYAVRDVTGTVDCLPLIVASILGKKLAEDLDGLVLDVKFGSGAVMVDYYQAFELATALTETARSAGTPTLAVLSDMNQALARNAGNALEILEIIELLNGQRTGGRLFDLSRALSADLLRVGSLARDHDDALAQLDQAWQSGQVAERFARMNGALGGPADLLDRPDHYLPSAPIRHDLFASSPGLIERIDARALGLAVIELGGGRHQASDTIDPAVGLENIVCISDAVDNNQPLLTIHARSDEDIQRVTPILRQAFILGDKVTSSTPLIRDRIED